MIFRAKIWENKNSGQKLITVPSRLLLRSEDEVFVSTTNDFDVDTIKDKIINMTNEDFKEIHILVNKEYLRRLK